MTGKEISERIKEMASKTDAALIVAEVDDGIAFAAKGDGAMITTMICHAIRRTLDRVDNHQKLAMKLTIKAVLDGSLDALVERLRNELAWDDEGEVIYDEEDD